MCLYQEGFPVGEWLMTHYKGEVKDPGMDMELEDYLAKKLALMLEYDKVPGFENGGHQRRGRVNIMGCCAEWVKKG